MLSRLRRSASTCITPAVCGPRDYWTALARSAIVGWACWLALGSTIALAQDAPSLTLQAAIDRALAGSPALGVRAAQLDAAGARVGQAELGPQFQLGLEFENFAGSGELSGTDALETTLELSRALELGDKRRRRVEAAQAGRAVALAELDVAKLDVAADAARKFVTLIGAQEQEKAARRFLDLAESMRVQAEKRVAAGNALSAELYRARASLGREQLAVLRAEAEREGAWRALAATWGMTGGGPDAAPASAAGDLFAVRPLEPLPDLLARVEASPRFAGLAAGERLREAERRLAEAQARPDLELALGVRRVNDSEDTGLVAGIAVPLGSRARSRAQLAESDALLAEARADRKQRVSEALVTLGGLHREAELRQRSIELLGAEILPASNAALAQIERGYKLGRLSYGEYSLASREALDAELERTKLAAEYHQLLIEIESLSGAPLKAVETAR